MGWRDLRWPRQRGQSMVEFALVGPLFIAIVWVIAEGSVMMNSQASLDNAAREGAREAIVCPNDQADALQADCPATVRSAVLDHLGLANDQTRVSVVTCTPDPSPSAAADYTKPCPSAPDSQVCQVSTSGSFNVVAGAAVEVDVYYRFDYYLGALVGQNGPSTCMSSRARITPQ